MANNSIGSATFGLVVGLGRFKKDLAEAEQVAKREGENVGEAFSDEATDEVGKSGSRWADALKKLGPAILAGGVALGALAVAGLNQGMEAESAGAKLAAQMGLSPEEAERTGRIAGDLYAKAYGESLDQVHSAVGAVASTLTDLTDEAGIERLTRKAIDFATAFDTDVSRAVNSAGILLSSGLVSDADEAFDLIVAASQRMPAHMREELLEASDEYSKFFAALGISGTDAFGILVKASESGMYGIDKAGDAIKELTIRATDMSAASVEAFELAGLDAERMAARFVAGGGTAGAAFEELIDGLLGIQDPVARANAAIALFGTPIEDLGVTEIPAFLRSLSTMEDGLGDVGGTAERMGDTLNDTAAVEWEAFKRQALQGISEFAMKYALPAMKAVAGFVNDNLLPAIKAVTDWAKDNTPVVIGIATAIGVPLVAAFGAWAVSALAAAAATLAAVAPLVLVGAAIGALVALVVVHWDTIRDTTVAVFGAVKDAVTAPFEWMSEHWPKLLGVLTGPFGLAVGIISGHWDTIKNAAATAASFVTEKFDTLVSTVTGLPGRIRSAAAGMWDGISDAFRDAMNWIIRGWNRIEFRIPGFKIGPVGYSGFTLGVPDIPLLATGGNVSHPGLALVGERGPELLSLPMGARVTPLDRVAASQDGGGDRLTTQIFLDGRLLAEYVTDYQADQDRRNGRGRAA